MTTEVHEIRIDIIPDRADAAVVDADLAKVEAQANATRDAIAKSTNINPAAVQAGAAVAQRSLEAVSRSAQETKLSAAQLETAFAEVFSRTTSERAVAAQGQLQGALGKTRTAGLLAEEEIEALMSEGDHGAQAALRGLGNEAEKARAKFVELKAAEKGTQAGFGFDPTTLQNYRAALENVKRAREDAARVQGLSKGEAEQLQAIVGPTLARARAQSDLNSLLAQGKITAQQHTRAVNDLANAERRAASSAFSLGAAARGALAALGVGISVKQVLDLSQAYANVENKLKTVTKSQEDLATTTRLLFDVANSTRQSFEATATVYSRLATSTKSLGLTQTALVSFTKQLNQAVAVSGATAAESSAGLIQFSQGLSAGALRGDELRSVLEQLPAVADVIAEHFKVSRGELRGLAEQGLLTTSAIVDAFSEAAPRLGEAFGKSTQTLGQSLDLARNNFVKFFGEFDKAIGLTTGLGKVIVGLSGSMEKLGGEFILVAGIISAGFVGKALKDLATSSLSLQSSLPLIGGSLAKGLNLVKAHPVVAGLTALAAALIAVLPTAEEASEQFHRFADTNDEVIFNLEQTAAAIKGLNANDLLRQGIYIDQFGKQFHGVSRIFREDVEAMLQKKAKLNAARVGKIEEASLPFRDEAEALNQAIAGRERYAEVLKVEHALRKDGITLSDAERAAAEKQQDELNALRNYASFLKELRSDQKANIDLLNAAGQAYDEKSISLEHYTSLLREFAQAEQARLNRKDLSKGEVEAYDAVNKSLEDATNQLANAESAAKKAGESGKAYAGVIADLKAKLVELSGVRGLSSEQIRVREEVIGSFLALDKAIEATKQLMAQGGQNADLYRAHLADLEKQKKDAFEVRGLSAGQRRLFEELSGEAKGYEEDLRNVEALIQRLRGTPLEVQLQAKRRETVRAKGDLDSTRGLTRDEIQVYKEIRGPQEEYQHRLEDINFLLAQKKINEEEAAEAQDEALVRSLAGATSIEAGYTRAFAKIRLEAADSAKVVEQTFGVLINTAEKAFDEFVESGKVNFKELAYEAVKELTKIYFRLLLIKALAALVPGGELAAGVGSGVASSALEKRAGGGPVQAGRPYLVGEKGPELFTPGQSGAIAPNGSNVNVAAPTVNVTVANVQDASEIPRVLNSGAADTAVINILSRNRSAARKILA